MRRAAGFTLIEVLLALGIFLVGITALLGMFQFGGGMETAARAHGQLAPAVEPLVDEIRREVWMLDAAGAVSGLKELRGLPVPGAEEYRYDLEVEPEGEDPDLRRAALHFYRSSPERPVATVGFLLTRTVPLERRLQGGN